MNQQELGLRASALDDSGQADGACSTDHEISARAKAGSTNTSAVQSTTYQEPACLSESSAGVESGATLRDRRRNRRNRQITACLECRRRKLKCDRQAPCLNCITSSRNCLYLAPNVSAESQQRLTKLKERIDLVEETLKREVAFQIQQSDIGGTELRVTKLAPEIQRSEEQHDKSRAHKEEDKLEPTPLATQDNIYEDNTDEELTDLGIQMGKMRISERVGGWLRPKLSNEIDNALDDMQASGLRYMPLSEHVRPRVGLKKPGDLNSYIGPGPDYIAPSPDFFFATKDTRTSLFDYLPSKSAADRLISQYWSAVHYMCKVVHRPTFEARYEDFWLKIGTRHKPPRSTQATVLAAMLSGAVSMTHEQVAQAFNISKNALVESLRLGTEFALANANFLRTTKVETLQAFVMYLIPLVRAEVSRAHSTLVGSAIRLAECMGLHRDGTHYALTNVDVQVRRMLWHQLCFLDIRTCEATGPRPQNNADNYDTKMPWNVDDTDLLDDRMIEDRNFWTDMTFARICAECQEMRLRIWYDIIAIDKKQKSLTSVLVGIQSFISASKQKYLPMIDDSKPFQRLARLMLEIVTNTMYLQVLHRYIFPTTGPPMPDRLRQVLIEAGIEQIESSLEWESSLQLAPWAWYRGAFNQYHAALLLLVEVYTYPMRKEAERIWKSLDHIFEIPSHLAPKQKAELVLTGLRGHMETFHQMRKLKVSVQMQQHVSETRNNQDGRIGADRDAVGHIRQQDELAADGVSRPSLQFYSHASPSRDSHLSSNSSKQDNLANMRAQNQERQSTNIENQMQDIDWSEWEKAFDPAICTGDLNIPNFDMTSFTGNPSTNRPISAPNIGTVTASTISGITNSELLMRADKDFSLSNVDNLSQMDLGGPNTFLPYLYRPD